MARHDSLTLQESCLRTESTRSRRDHLVNLEGFYNDVKKWQTVFGVSLVIAIIGHSANATRLPEIEQWDIFGKGPVPRDELWWMLGTALLVGFSNMKSI